ncbi:LacI family DNA-binding transcriptional regulator [Streptomyces sp. NPDC048187]|uniref:LacI family DNA-binding transcriptional regulator n=1 Tax=Streptomyces sp. NPDC048187 TaxID=3365509 RepID=UPI00371BF45B
MHAEERHQELLRRLRESGSVRVTEVAADLGVSPITVRRDVEALAERGLVERVHGGAVLPEDADTAAPETTSARQERVFGLIVPAADYYYPEVIRGARDAAAERGIRLVLGISQYDPDEERAQARQMLADGIDGLLVTPCGPARTRDWPTGLDVPCVLVERRPEDEASDAERVVTDHVHGARIAVRHLVAGGRERIGLLLREDSPHGPLVLEGYRGGLLAAERPVNDAALFRLPPPGGDTTGRERVLTEFTDAVAEGRLDAAVVHNDHDAIVVLQRLRARGVDVPGDVAIVAYDDEVAALADIPLTAVAPPKQAVGAAAVDLLERRLADPARPRHRVAILPELHVRASSA